MNGSVDDTGKPLARASSDASHVRIIALAGRRADRLRVTPTGAQGRRHHAAGVRPLVARLVHGTGCRFARRRATACNPAATSAEICGVEKRGKSLRCNGEPKFRQLEPTGGLAAARRSPTKRCLTDRVSRTWRGRHRAIERPHFWIWGDAHLEHRRAHCCHVLGLWRVEHGLPDGFRRLCDADWRRKNSVLTIVGRRLDEVLAIVQPRRRRSSRGHEIGPQFNVGLSDQQSRRPRGRNAVPPPRLRRTLARANLGVEGLNQIGNSEPKTCELHTPPEQTTVATCWSWWNPSAARLPRRTKRSAPKRIFRRTLTCSGTQN